MLLTSRFARSTVQSTPYGVYVPLGATPTRVTTTMPYQGAGTTASPYYFLNNTGTAWLANTIRLSVPMGSKYCYTYSRYSSTMVMITTGGTGTGCGFGSMMDLSGWQGLYVLNSGNWAPTGYPSGGTDTTQMIVIDRTTGVTNISLYVGGGSNWTNVIHTEPNPTLWASLRAHTGDLNLTLQCRYNPASFTLGTKL